METFKPANHFGPACGRCKFSDLQMMQGQIQRVLVCLHSPPGIAVATMPRGGMQMLTQFPIMQPHQFCHQYQPRDENPTTVTQPDADAANSFEPPI